MSDVLTFRGHEWENRNAGKCWCSLRRKEHMSAAAQVDYEREFPRTPVEKRCTLHPGCIERARHIGPHLVLPPLDGEA